MSVLLKKPQFEGISSQELAQQIASKKKCEFKLPTWFDTPKIYYPKKQNIEQTSSEITALHKSEIVGGKLLLDLSGGFGVDSYFFSAKMEEVLHCEIDRELSEIAAHNFKILGASNIKTRHDDGIELLRSSDLKFDWIYLDPSRRSDLKGKVFMLADSTPDVTKHLDLMLSRSENILIKTSPLLDLSRGIQELQFVREIQVVAVNNEVKELLWIVNKGYVGEVSVNTFNLTKTGRQSFNFKLTEEKNAVSSFSEPLKYLYEPNAAIMKSGGFKSIGNRFQLKKLHEHTHVYTSDKLIAFPGRRFQLDRNTAYNKKEFKALGIQKANITTRNFPESVTTIRKKFKIREGGDAYLILIKDFRERLRVLSCKKV